MVGASPSSSGGSELGVPRDGEEPAGFPAEDLAPGGFCAAGSPGASPVVWRGPLCFGAVFEAGSSLGGMGGLVNGGAAQTYPAMIFRCEARDKCAVGQSDRR